MAADQEEITLQYGPECQDERGLSRSSLINYFLESCCLELESIVLVVFFPLQVVNLWPLGTA